MKRFNVTGCCFPKKHYMVDITEKLKKIEKLIDEEAYFTINRARQYGKTTTLNQVSEYLGEKYLILQISFEGIGDTAFSSEKEFCDSFKHLIEKEIKFLKVADDIIQNWKNSKTDKFEELSDEISRFIDSIEKEVVLLIDEVDKSSNNQLFLHFLGLLRNKFLRRDTGRELTFRSVVLVGVHDVRNLKLKLRPDEERKYNSPWNIATDFKVDMSFNPVEISTMLKEYRDETGISFDIQGISEKIYELTSGYPFLVSKICKIVDEELDKNWSIEGLEQATKQILLESNTLFDDLVKNLENDKEIYDIIHAVLVEGRDFSYSISNPLIQRLSMFSIIREENNKIQIHNSIFEKYIYSYMISKLETSKVFSSYITNNPVGNFDLDGCQWKANL